MKLIADNNTNIISQLDVLESLVTWPASFKKNIPANKDGCRALSIDFVGRATLEIQILLYMCLDAMGFIVYGPCKLIKVTCIFWKLLPRWDIASKSLNLKHILETK